MSYSSLVGQQAPDFIAEAVTPCDNFKSVHFSKDFHGKALVLFFYPLDFTFVCPSELIALNNKIEEFKKLGVEVAVVSIDSKYVHLRYKQTPIEQGGIGKVGFTMISDLNKTIASSYGVLHESGVALRGVFIIDQSGVVRMQTVHDLPFGRSIDEILRLIKLSSIHEKHGEVCPANWNEGKPGFKETDQDLKNYLVCNSKDL